MINQLDIVGDVYVCKEFDGKLYLGGRFTSINGQERSNFASIDLATGALTSFAPVFDSVVYCIEVAGSDMYIGGFFQFIDGVPIKGVTRFSGGNFIDLAPFFGYTISYMYVASLAYHIDTDTLFVSGRVSVTSPFGVPMKNIIGLHFPTLLMPFFPSVSSGSTNGLTVDQSNAKLYIKSGAILDISNPNSYSLVYYSNIGASFIRHIDGKVYTASGGRYITGEAGGYGPPEGWWQFAEVFDYSTADVGRVSSLNIQVFRSATHRQASISDVQKIGDNLYILGYYTSIKEEPSSPADAEDVQGNPCFAIIDTVSNDILSESILFKSMSLSRWNADGPRLPAPGEPLYNSELPFCMYIDDDRIHIFGRIGLVDGVRINGHYILNKNGSRLQKIFNMAFMV